MMTHKLGLQAFKPDLDDTLFGGLLEILQLAETDMTIFYRRLASLDSRRQTRRPDRRRPP